MAKHVQVRRPANGERAHGPGENPPRLNKSRRRRGVRRIPGSYQPKLLPLDAHIPVSLPVAGWASNGGHRLLGTDYVPFEGDKACGAKVIRYAVSHRRPPAGELETWCGRV